MTLGLAGLSYLIQSDEPKHEGKRLSSWLLNEPHEFSSHDHPYQNHGIDAEEWNRDIAI